MKILRISGKNLASLAGDFSVDFEQEPLASSGLFAISGPTGAGKTTLLDALCLALYDATPRLLRVTRGGSLLPDVGTDTVSAQDPRTLLRRGAAECHAEVDFVGNDNIRYRARWSVRRSRGKAGGGLQKSAMSLHRLPELAAIGGTKTEVAEEIANRIGLTFEQFTRAVLLAQNEFSAFLKTEENERGELLETLTGSTVYSAISRRAFERFKAEQTAMQQLSARLADQTPMDADARAALEAQCEAAVAALALADARKTALEQQLRWHQESVRLQRSQEQAAETLAAARADQEAAAQRRQHLATLDALEPARPLLAEQTRLENESATAATAVADAEAALATAQALHAQAAMAQADAAARLHDAEQRRAASAPVLDQAKALDAAIASLAPAHAKAEQARAAAQLQLAEADRALKSTATRLAALRAQQEAGAAWLDTHRPWESLSAQWPRWDTLLSQAGQTQQQIERSGSELEAAVVALDSATARERKAAVSLATTTARVASLEAARQAAISAFNKWNGDQLRAQRTALEQRREMLSQASRLWSELDAGGTARAQEEHQAAALTSAKAGIDAALAAASAAEPALAAALAQSERSLQAAELACADSVEDLRAQLEDGAPCPVCGSAEHPYQHGNAALHGMLDNLRAEVARCRSELHGNAARLATQGAELASTQRQLAALADSLATRSAAIARLETDLQALPLMQEAPAADHRAEWLAQTLDQVKASILELDASEGAMRAAASARDAAQAACDQAAAEHARSQAEAGAAAPVLVRAQAAHTALVEKNAVAAETLAALLTELDGAFAVDSNWRLEWQGGPAAFRSARDAQVTAWREQSTAFAARATAMSTLEAEHAPAVKQQEQAQRHLAETAATFAGAESEIASRRALRATLWDGRPVAQIESELAAAAAEARQAVNSLQAAAQLAAQGETRARESLAQAVVRRDALNQQAGVAVAKLVSWLARFDAEAPGAVSGETALGELLAIDRAWIAQERAALRAIDAAAEQAATILAERSGQYTLHRQSASEAMDADTDLASLGAALDTVSLERSQAHDAAGALRVQLAQDDARRASATALMAEIERQQAVELRWGRMNELIGSADGKKFRNYAQQFTLDVLLGYANSHLQHLARRYRLERVATTSGPSLGLMVRDQDMGGEIRSVNSLSGGESFLVSLALALGLASLSSNRVRVESLFIDEGFGSLDSETLRVAMDALDGLQSMGRKVGVISHVQEMTERIATKILVQPAGGGTSSVTVQ